MRQSSGSSGEESVISRLLSSEDLTLVGARICQFLRGLHPMHTADNVAADLHRFHVKSSTVAKMLERESAPCAKHFIAMFCVYGLEFLCEVLVRPPAWMVAARRAERQAALEREMAGIAAELERLK